MPAIATHTLAIEPRRRGMTRKLFVILTVSATLIVSTSAIGAITPEKVQGGSADQFRPSSNGTDLAWSQYKSRRYNVYVRPLDDPSVAKRVNEAGTQAWMGSFMQGTDEIVFQQVHRRASDLFVYDVSDLTREKLKGGVSSSDWEWWPAASSQWVLFLRDVLNHHGETKKTQLLLGDLLGGTVQPLISDVGRKFVIPNFAGNTYVSWTVCFATCNVFYRNLDTDVTKKLPMPADRLQYASFIDEIGGFIYFVRSGTRRCGQSVTIRRTTLADPSTSVALTALPKGIDTDWMISVTENPASTDQDLYFGRFNCAREDIDVYVLRGSDTFTAQIRAVTSAGVGSWRASMRQGRDEGAPAARA
jgi:hypothetical protein